jgi:hypothetical protein
MSHVDHIPSVAREATAGLRELRHLVGCLLLLICLGVSLIALLRPRHVKSTSPVNAENYARITLGMRQEEVEHVFGGPARREKGLNEPILLYPVPRSFPPAEVFTRNGLELRHGKRRLGWISSDILALIEIDESRNVVRKDMLMVQHFSDPGPANRLMRLLRFRER